ncbi:MAG: chromosome partitioning protein [Actinobacteria bacterium]|nr:chromosome partitioning protein [Actinomycetota bacterium]
MRFPILTAADGAGWESRLVLAFEDATHGVDVVRRCVDLVELLAVAAAGQARGVLVAGGLRRLDADAVERLATSGAVVVGVIRADDAATEDRLRAMGVRFTVPDDAEPGVVATVLERAIADADPVEAGSSRHRYADPAASSSLVATPAGADSDRPSHPRRAGSVVAVWGPTGAPGRTTVAVGLSDHLARLGCASFLVDADVYGGVVATVLGLLDESPGLAAACRQAGTGRLDVAGLAGLSWQVTPNLRVLTGIPRAERWPELRPSALSGVLQRARELADFVIVDCGFCLETDEELAFDTLAPRRNGATLTVLADADLIVVVGGADPVGLQRLVRALDDLRDAEIDTPSWVVANKVRSGVVPGDASAEVAAALDRFAGRQPAATLPYDRAALDAALTQGKTLSEAGRGGALNAGLAELAAAVAGVSARRARRRTAARRGR